MQRRWLQAVTVIGLNFLVSSSALAQPVINFNPQVFRVGQTSGTDVSVPAVETLTTAAEFYDFRSASSHMGFEEVGLSLLLLHLPHRRQRFWLHLLHLPKQACIELLMSLLYSTLPRPSGG